MPRGFIAHKNSSEFLLVFDFLEQIYFTKEFCLR
jgi:hypothetical protein